MIDCRTLILCGDAKTILMVKRNMLSMFIVKGKSIHGGNIGVELRGNKNA